MPKSSDDVTQIDFRACLNVNLALKAAKRAQICRRAFPLMVQAALPFIDNWLKTGSPDLTVHR
jgi:hypothetical protein